jgi:hypothetical protein
MTAQIARALSKPLTLLEADERAGAVLEAAVGAAEAAPSGAGGAAEGAEAIVAEAVGGAEAGSVGNLIVGEAVGLGGKLMRTVSFLT